jgi:hypothetical protein
MTALLHRPDVGAHEVFVGLAAAGKCEAVADEDDGWSQGSVMVCHGERRRRQRASRDIAGDERRQVGVRISIAGLTVLPAMTTRSAVVETRLARRRSTSESYMAGRMLSAAAVPETYRRTPGVFRRTFRERDAGADVDAGSMKRRG